MVRVSQHVPSNVRLEAHARPLQQVEWQTRQPSTSDMARNLDWESLGCMGQSMVEKQWYPGPSGVKEHNKAILPHDILCVETLDFCADNGFLNS